MKLWGVRLGSCINESVSHDTLPRSSLLRQNIQVNLGKRRCRDKDEIGAEIWNVLFFPPGARASQMLTGADSSWYEFLFTRYLSTQPSLSLYNEIFRDTPQKIDGEIWKHHVFEKKLWLILHFRNIFSSSQKRSFLVVLCLLEVWMCEMVGL